MAELSLLTVTFVLMAAIAALCLGAWILFTAMHGAVFLFKGTREINGLFVFGYFVMWIVAAPGMLLLSFIVGLLIRNGRREERRGNR